MATPQQQPASLPRRLADLAATAVGTIGDKIKDNHMSQPSFTGQVEALTREMAKDVHSTMQEMFFGKPAGQNELGTPLAPTQLSVNADLGNDPRKMSSMDDLRKFADGKSAEASKQMEQPSKSREGREM